jgi:hypothetical protein
MDERELDWGSRFCCWHMIACNPSSFFGEVDGEKLFRTLDGVICFCKAWRLLADASNTVLNF